MGFVELALSYLAVLHKPSHVAFHLLDLGKETDEVVLDRVQEVCERDLNLLHLLLNADDTLVELLPNVGRARVVLVLGHEHLVSLNVRHLLLLQLNVVVGGALVDNLDVGVLVAHDLILDGALVAVARLVADVAVDQRVLGEHFAHQELLGKGERLNLDLGNVHELGLGVVAQVVVAEEGVAADLMRDLEWHLVKRLLIGVETDANSAVQDEVHLKHLLLLVVDDVLVLLLAEVARLEAESHIVKELAVLVLLRVEEEAEVVEDIIKQVVHDDAALDLARQRIDELVVLLHLAQPVLPPVLLEVLIDLAVERVGQGLVPEARQQGHPVVQVKGLLLIAQVLVESRDNFNERAHDVGEERYATKHDKDAENLLLVRLWVKVTVAHRREGRDREVARRDHLIVAGRLLKLKVLDEVGIFVLEQTGPQVEDATDEVGDDDCQEDEAEDAVDVLHNEGKDHFLAARLVREDALNELVDAVHLQQRKYALDSDEAEELEDHGVLAAAVGLVLARRVRKVVEQVKGSCGDHLEEQATALDVRKGDHTMSHLVRFFVLGQAQEFEKDVESEEDGDQVFDPEDPGHADVEVDGGKVHRREARVDDDDQHEAVPEGHERTLGVELHPVLAASVLRLAHGFLELATLVEAAAH